MLPYYDKSTPQVLYVYHAGNWYTMPASHHGWLRRARWYPSEDQIDSINTTEHFHNAVRELADAANDYGVPLEYLAQLIQLANAQT